MTEEKLGVFAGILKAQAYLSKVGVSKGLDVNTGAGSYKARGIDGVMNAVSSALVCGEIFPICNYKTKLRENITVVTKFGEKQSEKVVVEGEFYFMAADGSKSPTCTYEAAAINNSDKGLQIAMSYCFKYFLAQCLAIPFDGLQEEGETENHQIAQSNQNQSEKKPYHKLCTNDKFAENKDKWVAALLKHGAEKFFAYLLEKYEIKLSKEQKNELFNMEHDLRHAQDQNQQ